MSTIEVDKGRKTITADFNEAKEIIKKKIQFDYWDKVKNKCTLSAIEQERLYLKRFSRAVLAHNLGLLDKIH